MASTINADNGVVSGSSGVKTTADTSGVLALQSNGTTGLTLGTDLVTTLAQPLPVGSGGTGATSLSGITTGTATNLAGGVAGAVPYQSGSGATGFSAAGTSGQVLTSAGTSVPTWTSQSSLTAGTATNLAGGSNGTIPYQSASGTTQMLAVGTTGQVLTSAGTGAPTWSTPSAGGSKTWTSLTSSGSYTVPAGVSSIRVYAFGKGGDAGWPTASSTTYTGGGGGGGCAYGDIAVTAGSTVTISISSGVATVSYGGTTLLTANPGQNGGSFSTAAGGTATKHASVTNGGAYSGGGGGSNRGSGGSSGSPLGNGYDGNSGGGSGGAGWGGMGANNGGGGGVGGEGSSDGGYAGGGGGGAGGSASTCTGGRSRGIDNMFTDPLLADCTSCGGSATSGYNTGVSQAYYNVCGASAGNGGGGSGAFNGNWYGFRGGNGGMGGGGGGAYGISSAGACYGGDGGFGGGGGSSYSYSGRGGAGGYGGGGGGGYAQAFGNYGNYGGDAIVLIYA